MKLSLSSTEKGIRANSRLEWWMRLLFLGSYRPKEYKRDRIIYIIGVMINIIQMIMIIEGVKTVRKNDKVDAQPRDLNEQEIAEWARSEGIDLNKNS